MLHSKVWDTFLKLVASKTKSILIYTSQNKEKLKKIVVDTATIEEDKFPDDSTTHYFAFKLLPINQVF